MKKKESQEEKVYDPTIRIPGLGEGFFDDIWDIGKKLKRIYGFVEIKAKNDKKEISTEDLKIVITDSLTGPKVSIEGVIRQPEKKKIDPEGFIENIKWLLGKVF